MRLRLAEDYRASALPDWRAVQFTLILPFPATGLPRDQAARRFTSLGEDWIPGRYRGIQTITVPAEIDDEFVAPDYARDGSAVYGMNPRAFHQSADSRFKGPLGESVGASSVDADLPGARTLPIPGNDSDTWCHRHLFDVDTFSTVSPSDPDTPDDHQPSFATAKYELRETVDPDSSYSSRGSVRLVCAEFLQYRGVLTHRSPCTDEQATRHHSADFTRGNEVGELAHDYLVLHVIAENCSGESLEEISKSLHRPRHRVTVRPWSATDDDSGEFTPVSLLTTMVGSAVNALNAGSDGTTASQFSVHVSPGGRLTGGHPVPDSPEIVRRPGERPVHVWRDTGNSQPVRVVCAVPGADECPYTGLFGEPADGYEWSWFPQDLWALVLGSGADEFSEAVPRYSDSGMKSPDKSNYEYWTMLPTRYGAGLVRNTRASAYDAAPWMLAGTRLTDIALLIHRSSAMLSNISDRLRAITFSSSVLQSTGLSLDGEAERLTAALSSFQDIQSDFVRLRDRLWFNDVPDRDLDTEFMSTLRDALGVTRRFEDISDELALRESVYSVQFHQRQVQLDRDLRRQADAEAAERQAEKDLRHEREQAVSREREKQDRRQNLWFGFLALVFAVPGVIQMSPLTNSWTGFAVTTLLIVGLVSGFALYNRPHTGD